MTFVRGTDGQVIEFAGRQARKNYDKAEKRAEPEPKPEERRASVPVRIAGRILKPLTAYIRRRFKIEGIMAKATFLDDGYSFWISSVSTDRGQKTAAFSEWPGCKFKMWRG